MTKTRTKNTQASKPVTRDRVVYEVRGPQGVRQVDATTTAELKTMLAPLLGLDPYSIQAAAHLAHVERATVQGNGWSVRRLGVLSFVPDHAAQKPEQKQQKPEKPAVSSAEDSQAEHVQPPLDLDRVLDRLTPADPVSDPPATAG